MAESEGIEIRALKGIDEFVKAEDVERDVWQMEVDTPIVPSSMLSPISKNGGVVMGAFDGDRMVGVVCSISGA